jgi:hypothetical protein
MTRHGIAPMIVSRPMRGGHYGVLRFISIFDKKSKAEVEKIRAVNRDLLQMVSSKGFVMYKTPIWAWSEMKKNLDPGMLDMIGKVKTFMDPKGIMNPGRMGL